jgi:hypothetical protein
MTGIDPLKIDAQRGPMGGTGLRERHPVPATETD